MKKTKFIVGVMIMLMGVLAISPNVWAVSYVWVEESGLVDVEGTIDFNVDWEVGDPPIELTAASVEEFQWFVEGESLENLIGDWEMTSLMGTTEILDTGWIPYINIVAPPPPSPPEGVFLMMFGWWQIQGPQVNVAGFGHWER